MNTPVFSRWWAVAIIALVLANMISLFIFWRQQTHQPPPHREPIGSGVHHLLQSIGYSAAQLAEVDVLREAHEKNMQPLLASKRKLKEDFFSLTSKQTISDAELNAAAMLVANNEQALDKQTFSFIKKVRALANEQQAQQFDSSLRLMIGALVGGGVPPMSPPPPNQRTTDNGKRGNSSPKSEEGLPEPPPHGEHMPPGAPPPPPAGVHHGPPPPPPGNMRPGMPPPPPPIKNDMHQNH